MTDGDDFLARIESISRNHTGEAWSPEAVKEAWPLYGADERANTLVDFDAALTSVDTSDLRRYAQLTRLRQDLDVIHHTLRKVGR